MPPPIDRAALPRFSGGARDLPSAAVSGAMDDYFAFLRTARDGDIAASVAPVPTDPAERPNNLKAAAYVLDASLVGTCRMLREGWTVADPPAHGYAIVIALAFRVRP